MLGKVRVGKSALINAFAKKQVAKEGVTTKDINRKVLNYKFKLGSTEYSVWEMPGLQDDDELNSRTFQKLRADMQKEKCTTINLVIYCVAIKGRFEKSETEAIDTITKLFGREIWKNAIFALTYANRFLPQIRSNSVPDEIVSFNAHVGEFRKSIEKSLSQCKISNSNIKVIPTGYHTPSRSMPKVKGFFGIDNWCEAFERLCCYKAQQRPFLLSQVSGQYNHFTNLYL